jgi:hypothetical protein
MREFETLGQWHDNWAWVLLSAPDGFRDVRSNSFISDQQAALKDAYGQLRSGFHFAERKLKDERLIKIAAELIEMSLEAYLSGDSKTGAHTLQECEGLIWPGRRQKVKYGIEAERRVFGKNVLYAGMTPSPFPYEGSEIDLGSDQALLLELAIKWSRLFQKEHKDFRYFSWVITTDGKIRRTSVEPKEDEHPVLRPAQRSWGFKRLSELGQNGDIRACVLMEILGPLGDGLVCYNLEELGRPRVSARQLFKRTKSGIHYEVFRYHLEEPQILPVES